MFTVARLFNIFTVSYFKTNTILTFNILGIIITFFFITITEYLLPLTTQYSLIIISSFFIGAFIAPLFPLAFLLPRNEYKMKLTQSLTSKVLIYGNLGILIFPYIIGKLMFLINIQMFIIG